MTKVLKGEIKYLSLSCELQKYINIKMQVKLFHPKWEKTKNNLKYQSLKINQTIVFNV